MSETNRPTPVLEDLRVKAEEEPRCKKGSSRRAFLSRVGGAAATIAAGSTIVQSAVAATNGGAQEFGGSHGPGAADSAATGRSRAVQSFNNRMQAAQVVLDDLRQRPLDAGRGHMDQHIDTGEQLIHEGGIAQVMIEKVSPKRDAILATFAQRLGIGWRGDEFTSGELTSALFQMPVSLRKGLPKIVTIMMAVMAALLLAAIVAGYLASHHQ